MFTWENLPDTIDVDFLNACLWLQGKAVVFKHNGKLYGLNCSLGGQPNEYYMPTDVIIVNPVLRLENTTFKDGENCVVIYRTTADRTSQYTNFKTSVAVPTYELLSKTAMLLADGLCSTNTVQKNTRFVMFPTAPTPAHKKSIDKLISDMYVGKPIQAVTDGALIDEIKINPLTQSSIRGVLTELTETQQYVLANFYHSFGVNANYNMKRERLNTSEVNTNNDCLQINIKDMLDCGRNAVNAINAMFGTEITFDLSEEWQKMQAERSDDSVQDSESVE